MLYKNMNSAVSTILRGQTRIPAQVFSIGVRMMSSVKEVKFETIEVSRPREFVAEVKLNRPAKLNSMTRAFWAEFPVCFDALSADEDCRVVIVTAAGKHFTAGLDLQDAMETGIGSTAEDVGRQAMKLKKLIASYQNTFTSIERCRKPVLAAIHGACVGGGVDLITACDIRYGTSDAFIQVKEVDIGLAADVGTLQRLPKVLGNDSLSRELCYTARKMFADEALSCGLFSRVFQSREDMYEAALETASIIAAKSPIAVQCTKESLVYSRDHSVAEGLRHVGLINQGMLQSEDIAKAAMAFMAKKTPTFSKL